MKWSEIPDEFKKIIRQQYSDYCNIVEKQKSFKEWAKDHGYEVDNNK